MSNSPVPRPWSSVSALLDPDFGIAPDVTFQIETTEGGEPGQVKAHRLIVGFLSPVFRNQFYSLVKDTNEVISVKDTTKVAFETLIDFIYGKNINWEVMSLSELFDIVNLAEFYILPEFMEEVIKQIANYDLTDENLIEAAAIAEAFGHFKEASDALMSNCQSFVKNKIQTVQDAAKFASKHASTEFGVLAFKLLASLENQVCSNCGRKPCNNGMFVTEIEDMTAGCRLKSTDEGGGWDEVYQSRSCTVIGFFWSGNRILVKWDHTGIQDVIFRCLNVEGSGAGGWKWRYACNNV